MERTDVTREADRLRQVAKQIRQQWTAGLRGMHGSDEDARLVDHAVSYGRDPTVPYKAIEADLLEAKALAQEEAARRLRADAELLAKLVDIIGAAAMFEPYDYWSDIRRCLANPPGGPSVSHARQALAIAREVVPSDADGGHQWADLLGAAAYELVSHEVHPARARDLVLRGTVTIEGLARRARRNCRPPYKPTQEEWEGSMLVEVPHHVGRQMYLYCQFLRPGAPREGLAVWRQVGDSTTSRVFEVYALFPPMRRADEELRVEALRCGEAKLRHPGLNKLGIE
jgi:hypothetical protein